MWPWLGSIRDVLLAGLLALVLPRLRYTNFDGGDPLAVDVFSDEQVRR